MESNKELNFADSNTIADLKQAVRNYVSGGESKVIIADYHITHPSFFNENQRQAFTEELQSLEKSGNAVFDIALHTLSLFDDGNTDEALKNLEILDLKAENYQLQLQLLELKFNITQSKPTENINHTGAWHHSDLTRGVESINAQYTEQSDANEALRKSEEKFRLLSTSIPQFIWTLNSKGKLDYFNDALIRYSGYTAEEINNGAFETMLHPEDREVNRQKWLHSFATGEEFNIEHRLQKYNGDYRWHLCRALAQKNEKGEILQWVGTSTDIHDQKTFQKTLETLVEERTNELRKANLELESMNKELASFAYISSHDLQEPLRKIHTFGSIIMSNEYDNLSESGKRNFSRMQLAAGRMTKLIQDLLTYSRSNAAEKTFEETDLNALLREVASDFADSINDKDGILSIGQMPTINAIPFQIRQLFNNLVSNALKFTKENVPPAITILSETVSGNTINNPNAVPTKDYLHVWVTDNGIGFSPQYASRIFEVFQRLHGKGEYEGTGIGLAICMRIAENHKAILNASSNPGEGAVFNIYFPLN